MDEGTPRGGRGGNRGGRGARGASRGRRGRGGIQASDNSIEALDQQLEQYRAGDPNYLDDQLDGYMNAPAAPAAQSESEAGVVPVNVSA